MAFLLENFLLEECLRQVVVPGCILPKKMYGAQNETYNDGKDVKWWNALSAKELRV